MHYRVGVSKIAKKWCTRQDTVCSNRWVTKKQCRNIIQPKVVHAKPDRIDEEGVNYFGCKHLLSRNFASVANHLP